VGSIQVWVNFGSTMFKLKTSLTRSRFELVLHLGKRTSRANFDLGGIQLWILINLMSDVN